MCHVSTPACAGQSVQLFDVVAVDRLGNRQESLGRGLLQSGAVSQAAGFNRNNTSELVAIVVPADGEPVEAGTQKQASRRLLIMDGKAQQYLLPVFCSDDDLEFYRDIIDDCQQVDIVEDCQASVSQPAAKGLKCENSHLLESDPENDDAAEYHRDLSCEVTGWEMKLHKLLSDGWRPRSVQDVARISYSLEQLCGVVTKRNGITRNQMELDWKTGHSYGSHFPAIDEALGIYCVQRDVQSMENESEASSTSLDASEDSDDSDVDDSGDNAAGSEPGASISSGDGSDFDYDLNLMFDQAEEAAKRGDIRQVASVGIRYALGRYLRSLIEAVIDNKIQCAADIGMMAKGLERFCAQVIDGDEDEHAFHDWTCEAFDDGYTGNVSNDYGTDEAVTAWLDYALQQPA